ncbi:MAG TPA: DUF1206 domain-containing protein, partial [Acidimicrobiales bacterium]|nr:DUF1206 domain-containing protein [Acidimicrobiales bacterium]
QARRAGDSEWLDRVARVGFAGRGLLYLTVAFLAVGISRGQGGQNADKQGAVRALAGTTFGSVVLVVLIVGFGGFALWQAAEAAWGRRDEGDDAKRAAKRAASGGKALVYAALAASTAAVLFGSDARGGDQQESTWTARVFELPGGQGLVGLAGLVLVGVGGWLAVRGVRRKFEEHLDTGAMPAHLRGVTAVGGAVGHTARGVVAGLAGLLLVKAALDYDPQQAKGIDGTLRTISEQPYGRLLLLLAAAGLAAFGLFSFVEALYRRL